MKARAVRKKRNDAASLKFCDVEWRFLRTPTASSPPSSFEAGFIDRLQADHSFGDDSQNGIGGPRVLAMLTGEAAKNDMLDSLMTELNTLREAKDLELRQAIVDHQRAHGFTTPFGPPLGSLKEAGPFSMGAIASAKTMAKRGTMQRQRSSIHNPDDMAAAQASAKAAVQASLEKAHEDATCLKADNSDGCDRPTTPHIIWRTSDRVHLATDIPSQLMAPSNQRASPSTAPKTSRIQLPEKPKKSKYGAWYMPPQEWGKQTVRRSDVESLRNDERALEIRDQIPKLFIAREYKNFILAKSDALPSYLDSSG
ncbi:hypothetical protein H310_07626 [Aphanomyces invadans]|uniref:Uncharacterized protein n=1 Tax=Aphanomyces invadans TaxID=157072 RepID=A0A024U1Y1_9STRA|nr:hypothetical protein H310_07626 [Aphanomyces invadans]ETW00235.1 hypothetical protein H310_07626 [Aphanomyces invadans]|eukprot:XP_008871260.1 hypothetical protein H310_07626 [Aphanomyces invadans]